MKNKLNKYVVFLLTFLLLGCSPSQNGNSESLSSEESISETETESESESESESEEEITGKIQSFYHKFEKPTSFKMGAQLQLME